MSVIRDLLLVAIDPTSGKVRLPSMSSDALLGGAALIELVQAERVSIEGDGRKAKVVVSDVAPVDDPVVDSAFDRIRQRGREAPRSSVRRLGRKLRPAALEAMAGEGTVRDRDDRWLGIHLERFEVVDVARRDDLIGRAREVLLQGLPADAQTGPLIGLLHAAKLLHLVVDRPDVKRAKAQADVVSEGDWASDAVRKAIQDTQVMLSTVVAAGAVAGGSS